MAESKKLLCIMCKKPAYRSVRRFNENLKFGWKTYCSRKCEYRHKRKRQQLACENCGKRFTRRPNEISPHNYCSKSCAAIMNNKKWPERGGFTIECKNCGTKFKKWKLNNKKYCSLKCREKAEWYTPEKIIKNVQRYFQNFGRIPTKREMRGVEAAGIKFFGSWNKTIIAAGFNPNRSHNQRMYKRNNARAIDGHICDSISELLIDNWLTQNKIGHKRNTPYPDTNHKSDWSISSKNKTIFIEYFGLAKDSPRYDRSVRKKKTLCRKHNIELVEIYSRDLYPKINLEAKLRNF